MSSWFFQVTVVPTFPVSWAGAKVKLSIVTVVFSACAAPGCWQNDMTMTTTRRTARLRRVTDSILNSSALQRRVDDREALIAGLEIDAGDAEQAAKLVVGDLHRTGRGRGARRRLRERGRARGVEGDVALDLLHHLVDMAVEHRHRAETLEVIQRAGAVLGAPAPLRIDRPQRNMGEHDNGRRFRAPLEVILKPFKLIGAEIAEAAGLEVHDVDETDEVDAAGVERIPAGTLGVAFVALAIELDLFVEEIVLARHVMHVELGLRDDALGVVELGGLRQMGDVAGMDHE